MEQPMQEVPSSSALIEDFTRACKSKKRQIDPTTCPVCSCTLRPNEVDQHLDCEIEKLQRINVRSKQNGKAHSLSPTNNNNSTSNGIDDSVDKQHWETYQKVRTNRQCRQKAKTRKRRIDEVTCPVCNKDTSEEINAHVEQCLRRTGGEESDETIDVEAYEEYEWAGQSRVRATSMLHGGIAALGTPVSMADEDEDLVVDGDDSQMYGSPQYTERDVVVSNTEDALRKAVLGPDVTDGQRVSFVGTTIINSSQSIDDIGAKDGDPTIEALKNRIRELEHRDGPNEIYKCLICMERYKTPVISVCCWHVHCEMCWLQTLGAKKLCPQCNMITSPADLRRIYI